MPPRPRTPAASYASRVADALRALGLHVAGPGVFAAEMQVALVNDGPVTILLGESQPAFELVDLPTLPGHQRGEPVSSRRRAPDEPAQLSTSRRRAPPSAPKPLKATLSTGASGSWPVQ